MKEVEVKVNRFWTLKRMGPRYYTARGDFGDEIERRVYYSRDALERDFGQVKFPDEVRQS